MARKEVCVLTNMVMVYDDSGRVLVQRRNDPGWPGCVFPGGHVEPGESFVDAAVREVREETGLTVENLQLCGVKQWTQKGGEYRYIVFLYKTNCFSGEVTSSDEGEAFWWPREELAQLELASGFEEMLPVFENDGVSEFFYTIENDEWLTHYR